MGVGAARSQGLGFAYMASGEMRVRATFLFEVPELDQAYGIAIYGGGVRDDIVMLLLSRDDDLGDLGLFLADESGRTEEGFLFPGDPEDWKGELSTIELELTLSGALTLLPHGRFKLDQEDYRDLDDLPPNTDPPADDAALDGLDEHIAFLFTTLVPEPSLALLGMASLAALGLTRRR